MDGYIKKSEAVDVIVKYPYEIAGKTATAIKMIEDLPRADVVLRAELAVRSFKDAATIYNLQEINKKLVSDVERLKAEKDVLIKNYAECMKDYASEIFAEFESVCLTHIDRYNRYIMYCEDFFELKKKYTEGKDDRE